MAIEVVAEKMNTDQLSINNYQLSMRAEDVSIYDLRI